MLSVSSVFTKPTIGQVAAEPVKTCDALHLAPTAVNNRRSAGGRFPVEPENPACTEKEQTHIPSRRLQLMDYLVFETTPLQTLIALLLLFPLACFAQSGTTASQLAEADDARSASKWDLAMDAYQRARAAAQSAGDAKSEAAALAGMAETEFGRSHDDLALKWATPADHPSTRHRVPPNCRAMPRESSASPLPATRAGVIRAAVLLPVAWRGHRVL